MDKAFENNNVVFIPAKNAIKRVVDGEIVITKKESHNAEKKNR